MPTQYAFGLTLGSIFIAVLAMGAGLTIAVNARATLGGAVVGMGVAAMHFVGMAAFEAAGRIVWDPSIVAIAIACSVGLGAASLRLAMMDRLPAAPLLGAGLLAFAICSLHFTAMGAVTIVPDPSAAIPDIVYSRDLMAVAVAVTSVLVIFFAGTALALDLHAFRRNRLEAERMGSLANASAEGLVICRGGVIVIANDNFARLASVSEGEWRGAMVSRFFDEARIAAALDARSEAPFDGELSGADGHSLPVELFVRAIDQSGGDRRYAIAARDLRARLEAEREIRHLAHHDPLTGLPNRASFANAIKERVTLAQSSGGRFGLLLIDLDRFKEINDRLGHAAGDAALKRTADSVSRLLQPGQLLARLGGDEFALLTEVAEQLEIEQLARAVGELLNGSNEDGLSMALSASVGSALFPTDAGDAETLQLNADIALYRAKGDGRGVWRAFGAGLSAEIHCRIALERDLRGAVKRGELSFVFQPQLSIATGALDGYEALARWRRPNGENVSPAVFIPLAEEIGLIGDVGEWALRAACLEAASWSRPLSVAVNVSAAQLLDPALTHSILGALAETGLSPERLIVEITETALVSDPIRALATMRQIKAIGVRISMDDFGIGYSSLSNLHMYPFDEIKIDRSFVCNVDSNPQKAAIVRTMISLGHELGLPVLAEGVETESELAFLREEKCDLVQGFLLGRPGPAVMDVAAVVVAA